MTLAQIVRRWQDRARRQGAGPRGQPDRARSDQADRGGPCRLAAQRRRQYHRRRLAGDRRDLERVTARFEPGDPRQPRRWTDRRQAGIQRRRECLSGGRQLFERDGRHRRDHRRLQAAARRLDLPGQHGAARDRADRQAGRRATIRKEIARQELANVRTQIDNANSVNEFFKSNTRAPSCIAT